jgi:hypothetical protein
MDQKPSKFMVLVPWGLFIKKNLLYEVLLGLLDIVHHVYFYGKLQKLIV